MSCYCFPQMLLVHVLLFDLIFNIPVYIKGLLKCRGFVTLVLFRIRLIKISCCFLKMSSYKIIVYVFLFFMMFITTDSFSNNNVLNINDRIVQSGITSQQINQVECGICINNTTYVIYKYNTSNRNIYGYDYNEVWPKLHLCINCVFAQWMRDELFKLVKYQTNFFPELFNILVKHLLRTVNDFNDLIKYVEQFVDILLNFTNMHLKMFDPTYNTNVLRTLLSFGFKINFIIKFVFKPKLLKIKKPKYVILRLIIGVINQIESFMFINCKLPSQYDNKEFKRFSMTKEPCEDTCININQFLDDIKPLQLESDNLCNVEQMRLQNLNLNVLGNVVWTTPFGPVNIGQTIQNIKKSYDLEIIFWYQKYMFNTLMKLLFTKILDYLKDNNNCLSDIIINVFNEIYSSILTNITNLPTNLMKCFFLLIENKMSTCKENKLVTEISNYINSIENIRLENNLDLNTNDNNKSTNNHTISTPEEFIRYLKTIIKDLKCFVRLFEFLQHENDKYNVSLLEKSEKIKLFVYESSQSKVDKNQTTKKENQQKEEIFNREGCNYFRVVYHYCIDAMRHYDSALINGVSLSTRAETNLEKVRDLLNDLLKSHWYLPHYKIVYNTLPVVWTMLEILSYNKNYKHKYQKRLLFVVLTELNNYGAQFCDPPGYNYFRYFDIKNDSTELNSIIQKSTDIMTANENKEYRCEFLNIWELTKTFNKKYKEFKQYNNIISLLWRGDILNIGYFLDGLKYSLSSSSNVYALNDMYLKFCFAAVYYEINQISNSQIDLIVYKTKYENHFKFLPNKFMMIFSNIQTLFDKYIDLFRHSSSSKEPIAKIKDEISILFKQIGIFVDLDDEKGTEIYTTLYRENQEEMKIQSDFDNVLDFVKSVNEHFLNSCAYKKLLL